MSQSGAASSVALARAGLRTKSTLVEEALTFRAFGVAWSPDLLYEAELAEASPAIRDLDAAAGLALLWAGASARPEAMGAAARLYARVLQHVEARRLSKEHQQAAAQAFFLAGMTDAATHAVETFGKVPLAVADYLRADLASPSATGESPSARWLELLSKRQRAHGIEPLDVSSARPDGLPWFDTLSCKVPERTGGELVSVIVPCFRPGDGLITALRSIVAQTWEDLEIIVVDDASGPQYEEWFARAKSLDPRIRVLSLDSNGGAYRARNAGIRAASGSIVTFQDDDDWSHPRRVEMQVARLNDSGALATRSAAVRARPDMTHQWFGQSPIRLNVSSLMLRRDALERIGPFFEVRKGADSEYQDRIVALGGAIENVPAPLAVVRLRPGSLSRGDFTYRWATPDRIEFRGAYEAWHRTLRPGRVALSLDPVRPPFNIPTRFELDGARRCLDVVYAADYSAAAGAARKPPQTGDLERRAERGVRQGLWHMETVLPMKDDRALMDLSWRDLIQSRDDLISICRTDDVFVRQLVVCDPTVLLINGDQSTSVQVEDVEVWLTPGDLEPTTSGLPVDILWISDRCQAWWSTRPRWVAAPYLTPDEKAELGELAGTLELGESRIWRP